jgi:hypothetical protein
VHDPEQDLDGMAHSRQGERQERRGGPHAADGQEPAQLVSDNRDASQDAESIGASGA